MNNDMDDYKKKELERIDKRIEKLKQHICSIGHDEDQPNSPTKELKQLELEKEDLINGTHKLENFKLKERIRTLEQLKSEASILNKSKYNKLIKEAEEERIKLKALDSLKRNNQE
ncbi:MAG: hypothetical protein VZS44_05570 [Bacilli bacterium]|nr:hypothetical protein [Bacilli bacterium]